MRKKEYRREAIETKKAIQHERNDTREERSDKRDARKEKRERISEKREARRETRKEGLFTMNREEKRYTIRE